MAKLTDTLGTDFRSEVGEFLVETFGGIRLLRKNAADLRAKELAGSIDVLSPSQTLVRRLSFGSLYQAS